MTCLPATDFPVEAAHARAAALAKHPTWAQAEGSPLPLVVPWIQEEQAFNFAVPSEPESITLLLCSAADVVNPLFTFRFDSEKPTCDLDAQKSRLGQTGSIHRP